MKIKIGSMFNQNVHNFFKISINSMMKRGLSILTKKNNIKKDGWRKKMKLLLISFWEKKKQKKLFLWRTMFLHSISISSFWRISFTSWSSPFSIASKSFSFESSVIFCFFFFLWKWEIDLVGFVFFPFLSLFGDGFKKREEKERKERNKGVKKKSEREREREREKGRRNWRRKREKNKKRKRKDQFSKNRVLKVVVFFLSVSPPFSLQIMRISENELFLIHNPLDFKEERRNIFSLFLSLLKKKALSPLFFSRDEWDSANFLFFQRRNRVAAIPLPPFFIIPQSFKRKKQRTKNNSFFFEIFFLDFILFDLVFFFSCWFDIFPLHSKNK